MWNLVVFAICLAKCDGYSNRNLNIQLDHNAVGSTIQQALSQLQTGYAPLYPIQQASQAIQNTGQFPHNHHNEHKTLTPQVITSHQNTHHGLKLRNNQWIFPKPQRNLGQSSGEYLMNEPPQYNTIYNQTTTTQSWQRYQPTIQQIHNRPLPAGIQTHPGQETSLTLLHNPVESKIKGIDNYIPQNIDISVGRRPYYLQRNNLHPEQISTGWLGVHQPIHSNAQNIQSEISRDSNQLHQEKFIDEETDAKVSFSVSKNDFDDLNEFNTNQLNKVDTNKFFVNSEHVNVIQTNSQQQLNKFNAVAGGGPATVIKKHVYFHVPPSDIEDTYSQNLPVDQKKKNYKIIFIKLPSQETSNSIILQQKLQTQSAKSEEKTLIYVLSPKPDLSKIQTSTSTVTTKPEVFYVKYKDNLNSKDSAAENSIYY